MNLSFITSRPDGDALCHLEENIRHWLPFEHLMSTNVTPSRYLGRSEMSLTSHFFFVLLNMYMISVAGENESIEELDLSWNNFRLKSGIVLCDGIAVSFPHFTQ